MNEYTNNVLVVVKTINGMSTPLSEPLHTFESVVYAINHVCITCCYMNDVLYELSPTRVYSHVSRHQHVRAPTRDIPAPYLHP